MHKIGKAARTVTQTQLNSTHLVINITHTTLCWQIHNSLIATKLNCNHRLIPNTFGIRVHDEIQSKMKTHTDTLIFRFGWTKTFAEVSWILPAIARYSIRRRRTNAGICHHLLFPFEFAIPLLLCDDWEVGEKEAAAAKILINRLEEKNSTEKCVDFHFFDIFID